MKLASYLLFVLFVSISSTKLSAQDGDEYAATLPVVVPPAPTASALGKYGDIPVSYYTGTPRINVPLYTLNERDLSVPISLSYHASGIKVDDVESWVGLGWTLNAGGVITRSIKGRPDEEGQRGFWNNGGVELQKYLNAEMTSEEKDNYFEKVAEGYWDTEPDVFHFNFNGRSGKMVFDHNKNHSFIPHTGLKLMMEMSGSLIAGFTVIDENGVQYVFNEIESSSVVPSGDSESTHGYTAWYLSEIISIKGHKITFSYVNESINYPLSQSETVKYLYLDSSCGGECSTDGNQVDGPQYLSTSKRLTNIQSDNIAVSFNPGNAHSFGFHELGELTIRNRREVDLFKKYVFQYGVIGTRLSLESVQEFDGNGIGLPAHSFEYYEPLNIAVPGRLSFQQDHWGFYNNNSKNTYLPEEVRGGVIYSGGSREPDAERTKIMTLNKINYPTGGYTMLDFEAHDYGYTESGEVNEPITQIQPFHATMYPEEVEEADELTWPFSVGYNQIVTLSANWDVFGRDINTIDSEEEFSVTILDGAESKATVGSALNMSSTTLSKTVYLEAGDYTLKIAVNTQDPLQVNATVNMRIQTGSLSKKTAGGVRIKKMTDFDPMTNKSVVHNYDYKDALTGRSTGVLMKSAVQYDWHDYQYKFSDTSCDNGGGGQPIPPSATCKYKVRTSSNKTSLGTTQGSHIGYRQVTVDNGGGAQGKTIYEFTSPYDVSDAVNLFPTTITSFDYMRGLPTKTTYLLAKWVEDEEEEDEILVFSPVREVVNTYRFREDVNKKEIWAAKVAYVNFDGYTHTNHQFEEARYRHVSQWYYLNTVEDKTYDLIDGTDFIKTITNYYHDNPEHVQLTETTNIDSKGQLFSVKTRYPDDVVNVSALPGGNLTTQAYNAISQLKQADQHRIAQPIQIERYQDINDNGVADPEELLFTQRTTFREWNADGKIHVLPEIVASLKGTASPSNQLEDRAVYYSFNGAGNPTEISRSDDRHEVYIWGYNQTQPVVKIENILMSEIANTLVENIDTHVFTESSAPVDIQTDVNYLNGQLAILRNDSRYMVTSYTYDPLVGMTSQTDANGNTMYYEYDDFGRLLLIKDQEGYMLKRFDYNFKP